MTTLTPAGSPNVTTLWRAAFQSMRGRVSLQHRALIAQLVVSNPAWGSWELTELQRRFLQVAEQDDLFRSHRNVCLSAPTSSGKTTLTDLFLARVALLNRQKRRAVYIAPTKALTQERHHAFLETFDGTGVVDEVVLSTAENVADDWRIAHGRFGIAFMVYEKCSLLFSKSRRLLPELGVLVIDELHMLSQLARGPNLEILLAKALQERSGGSIGDTERLRIVVATTEGAPGLPLVDLLTVRRGLELQPPHIIQADERPVAVDHELVLLGAGETGLTHVPIVTFSDERARRLEERELAAVQVRLAEAEAESIAQRQRLGIRRSRQFDWELLERGLRLVRHWLLQWPNGRRMLVAVHRKEALERLSSWAANERGTGGQPWGAQHPELAQHLDDGGDPSGSLVKKRLRAGVHIFHSDLTPELRKLVQNACSRSLGAADRSEIIFSTDALMYGVNLWVQDVAFVGLNAPRGTRDGAVRGKALTPTELHNLAGRAGRLGRLEHPPARVYLLPPAKAGLLSSVLRPYYATNPALRSSLFLPDHDDAGRHPSSQAVESVSYPFTRAVLDATRHVNLAGEVSGHPKPATADTVLELFEHTLYAREREQAGELGWKRVLRPTVDRILRSGASKRYRLLDPAHDGFVLTARGSAIIDTGTLVRTIVPLLELLELISNIWRSHVPKEKLPDILLLLGTVPLPEVQRKYYHRLPEHALMHGDSDGSAVSRARLLQALAAQLHGASDRIELATALQETLVGWATHHARGFVPRSKTGSDADFPFELVADSMLRQVIALNQWIEGRTESAIQRTLEEAGVRVRRSLFRSWRQYSDLASWKVRFAATMAQDTNLLGEEATGRLRRLARRVAAGCPDAALPFFWTSPKVVGRPRALALHRGGWTAEKVLTTLGKRVGMLRPADAKSLRAYLARHAVRCNQELGAALSTGDRTEPSRRFADALWATAARGGFESAVAWFRSPQGAPPTAPGLLGAAFEEVSDGESITLGARDEEGPRSETLAVERSDSMLSLQWPSRSSVTLNVVEFYTDFEGGITKGRWVRDRMDRALAPWTRSQRLLLVGLPWLPPQLNGAEWLGAREHDGRETTLSTFGAVSTVLTLVARGLVSAAGARRLLRGRNVARAWHVLDLSWLTAQLQTMDLSLPFRTAAALEANWEVGLITDPRWGVNSGRPPSRNESPSEPRGTNRRRRRRKHRKKGLQ